MAKAKNKTPKVKAPDQVEQALQQVLTSVLAIYILKTSSKPISQVINNLTDAQFDAAELVGLLMRSQGRKARLKNLNNTLTGVFSFIQFHAPERRPKLKKS